MLVHNLLLVCQALAAAERVGYPLMIKASEGGGGKVSLHKITTKVYFRNEKYDHMFLLFFIYIFMCSLCPVAQGIRKVTGPQDVQSALRQVMRFFCCYRSSIITMFFKNTFLYYFFLFSSLILLFIYFIDLHSREKSVFR